MSQFSTVAHWASGQEDDSELNSREQWYNMPGTSPYELNMNVSSPQGPHFGPKASIKHKITSKQGIFIGIGTVALICLIVILYQRHH